MLNTVINAQESIPDDRPADWFSANAATVALGLSWISARLALADDAEEIRKAYDSARTRQLNANDPASIDRLGDLFSLAPFDLDVLLLGCAAHLVHGIGSADLEMAFTVCDAIEPPEARFLALGRFSPDAPLRRFRLIEMSDSAVQLQSRFTIDERIMRLLLGDDQRVAAIDQALEAEDCGPLPEHNLDIVDRLCASMDMERPAAALVGAARSGRRATGSALARRFGLGIRTLLLRFLPSDPGERRDFFALVEREAAIGRFAVLVDIDEADGRLAGEDLLRGFSGFTIVVGKCPLETARHVPTGHCRPLATADRLAIWRAVLGERSTALKGDLLEIAEHFALGPREIARIARDLLDEETLWDACRSVASRDLLGLSERLVPRFGLEDIVLPPKVLALLHAIEAQVRFKSRVLGPGGFAEQLVRGRGTTALFAGPSGVGKTMAAEVLAHSLKLDLFRIDLSSVVSKYIGETERNLRQLFDAAEAGGCVLFFDEADALFGKRTEVKDSHDRYANLEISYLLQRMEAFSGLAILATNLKNNLDPAFLRRLRYVVDIPFPDAAERETLWRRAFPAGTLTDDLDYPKLSRLDFSGGNISVVAINAAYLSAAENCAVGMRHIERAARAEFHKLDRDFGGWA
ncbi:ATP-binding protein [Rhizobium grahamii]|uniref:ATPase AAA n=1 Tax=Rhizobium grahamii CCGE 502 TaxID=990285 RepID=S3HDF6_9HYPH|nr:ATP-binding protein [Rhizobium grahamii]EPE96739.1 ATPase AAA [Rhizobium grahamii CCGE 502]